MFVILRAGRSQFMILMVPYLVVTVEAVEAVPATEGFLDVLFIED